MQRIWLLTILIVTLSRMAYSQTQLTGMVADSATFLRLPNVSIQVKGRTHGTITDARGFFKIQVGDSDTLLFSMLGYRSCSIPVARIQQRPVVYMREEAQILETVEISAGFLIPGLDEMQLQQQAWQNPANTYGKVPGFQGLETFGPGKTFRGGEIQPNREEKKLKEVKKINEKSAHYVETVNSPEVKGKLMNEFKLTEEKYFELLSKFNQKNKDFIYELTKEELTSLLFVFFSENVNKK